MVGMIVLAVFGAIAGLVLYEIVEEIRGGSQQLHDRYHE